MIHAKAQKEGRREGVFPPEALAVDAMRFTHLPSRKRQSLKRNLFAPFAPLRELLELAASLAKTRAGSNQIAEFVQDRAIDALFERHDQVRQQQRVLPAPFRKFRRIVAF